MSDFNSSAENERIRTVLLDLLRKYAKADLASVSLDTKLADLQIDSFDFVELVFEIEDRFGVEIAFNANREDNGELTLGGVFDQIRAGLAEKASAA